MSPQRLSLLLFFCGFFALSVSGDGMAACTPSPVISGGTVTCTGADNSGVGTGGEDNVIVNIAPGASVQDSGENFAIDLNANAKVTNSGGIDGYGGIEVHGGSSVQNNEDAIIDADHTGVLAYSSIVVNEGTINAGWFGVSLDDHSTLLNEGTISASGDHARGVDLSFDTTVVNNGTVSAYSDLYTGTFGFLMSSGNTVTNNAQIEVKAPGWGGTGTGLRGTGGSNTVYNDGTIDVEAKDIATGIDLLYGEVVNTGDIVATGANAQGIIAAYELDFDNSGTITVNGTDFAVGVTATGGSIIVNSGKIIADAEGGSQGVLVGGNGTYETITIENSGTITAEVAVTSFQDSFPGIPAAAEVTNSGTINGDIVLFDASDTVRNLAGGKIFGLITLDAGANVVVNEYGALISAQGGAIRADSGNLVVNDGDIVSQEGIGIFVLNGNDIRNSGTITAPGQAGIGISASDNNDAAIDEDGWSGIINFGTIEAGYVGIAVGNESVLRNRGEITAGGTGIAVGDDNIVSNEGSIEVGQGGTGLLAGKGNNIRNSGTIVSGGDGVVIGAGSSFENQGEGSSVVAVGDALRIEGESSGLIFNTGLLKGEVAIRGSSSGESITSVGVLNGAVLLGDGDDTLQLQYDAVVDGDIDGGAGTDNIRVTSGVATINGRVTNVEQLTVTSIGLIFNAATGSQVGTTTVEDGALTLNGTLSTDMEVEIAGNLSGSTTINGHLQNAGTLEPGNVLGAVTIVGDYTQTATGRLAVELGSNAADVLNVTGAASLDGTLTTGLAGTDLAALEGKSYTVLSAGSIIGALDTNGIVQEGFWTIDVQQSGNAVTVTITDVDVTIGATAPVTDALANAVAAAAESGLAAFEGGQQLASLSYDSLADWQSAAPTFVAGWSEMGARTPAGAMPKTGTGEFDGTTKGELTETGSPEALVVEGNVLLTANFASGLVNADFTEMEKIDSKGVTSAWVDFRARMSIADGTSTFAGTAGTDDGVWNGEARGGFYGDEGGMPGHAAGLWSMSSPLGQAIGGFMAKRQ